MDRQTLRDWVHRFNKSGPDGLLDAWSSGPKPRLPPCQKAELATLIETGPDREADGVVRWRRVDLKHVIKRLSASTITSVMSERYSSSLASRI